MADKVEKSEIDARDYEYFVLSNSIKCIVISDTESETAAAAMNVHIGSIREDIPGLAHYLEHMLFMGTAKYPQENEYSNFLSDNAGSSNAFTDTEDTNFFFKVSSDQLYTALEMFSEFFVSPLFNESSLERELKAVDSEFHKNLLDDHWRLQQLVSSNGPEPINHFGLGNSKTLAVEGIRDKVIEFYNKYYSANLMTLVVYGHEDTNTLRTWAEKLFSPIKNNHVHLDPYPTPSFENTKTVTKIIPVKETNSLKLLWALPNVSGLYEFKPEGYIAHLLGHEGENSLLSCLKSENLAEELTCYHEDPYTFCGFLCVEVKLTDKGLQEYEKIIEIIHVFIKFLKQHTPQLYIFEELQQIAQAEFNFKNKKDPYWYCQKLSSRLVRYPPTKVLTAPEIYYKFSPDLIVQMLDKLCLDNLQVFLVSKSHSKDNMLEEQWFGTLYRIEKLSDRLLLSLLSPGDGLKEICIGLPKPNPYIPDNFNVLPLGTAKYPVKVFQDSQSTVWYKQDSKYFINKVYGQVTIFCNSCGFDTNPYFFMLARLWNKLLNESIREEAYLASLAGLKHEVDVDNLGLRITLNGFSDKYPRFIQYLIEKSATYTPSYKDTKLFENIKSEYINELTNCFFSKPTTQIQRIVYELNLVGGYFTQLSKLKALMDITLEDVMWFSNKWLRNVYFEWFVMGNLTLESLLSMTSGCTKTFVSLKSVSFLTPEEYLVLKTTEVPLGVLEFQSVLTDPANTNSAVISQWQVGAETVQLECLLNVLETYLEEPCFDTLRTKEQLGYVVQSYSHKIRGVFNFMILIQSSTHSPTHLVARITDFLHNTKPDITSITDKQFAKLVKATIESTLKQDLSLQEEYQRYKYEVDSAAYKFDRKKVLKAHMKTLEKAQFQQFFSDVFFDSFRRLDIKLLSQGVVEVENSHQRDIITSFDHFKRITSPRPQVNIRK